MSKQSKKATKRKKTEKKQKQKKKLKRLGLSRFVEQASVLKSKSRKVPKPVDQSRRSGQDDEQEMKQKLEEQKIKEEVIRQIKKQKKEMSLVDRCKLQMSSSLLRLVDEKLYTSDSVNGGSMITKDEFNAYHDAYGQVCDKWPTKPIDFLVRFIKKRLFTKRPANKWRLADIGCGREPLLKRKLGARVKCVNSFDLVSMHEDVIEANMDKLPVNTGSIDAAIYSLSLMAKNLGNILLECKRILKLDGHLLIVEVSSRFEGREKRFVDKLERIGFKKQSMSELKPNGYFTFFHFTKIDDKLTYGPSYTNIELKPCVYKAR